MKEKQIIEWESYDRPHKTWTKEFYSTVVVIAFLVSVILFFIEGVMPVVVVWALVFMIWSMNRVEPKLTKTTLTTWGIRSADRLYLYRDMDNFWFETKWSTRLLRVNLNGTPWHVVFVIDPKEENKIKDQVVRFVPMVEPVPTAGDKLTKWLGEKIPLE